MFLRKLIVEPFIPILTFPLQLQIPHELAQALMSVALRQSDCRTNLVPTNLPYSSEMVWDPAIRAAVGKTRGSILAFYCWNMKNAKIVCRSRSSR